MKMKASHRKAAAAAALFEKRLVIEKLIDRAQTKKMNLNGQTTHFYRLQAVLEATVQRLYNDLKRLENLERKRLYATATTATHHCKSLKEDFAFHLGTSSSSSSLGSSSSSSSSSENDEEILDFTPKQKDVDDDPLAIDAFFQRLKTVKLTRNTSINVL